MFTEIDSMTAGMLVALAAVLGGMCMTALLKKISRFRGDLRYINIEIGRTSGAEQVYWMEQRRQLWRSLLLFRRR